MTTRVRLLRLAALGLLLASAASCGLFVSFSSYDTASSTSGPSQSLFSVGGDVDGLEGAKVTVTLDGQSMTVPNGHFDFPATLAGGASFKLTAADPPGHTCSVERGLGRIAAANVTDVAVHCPSNDASLVSLSASPGRFSEAFDPAKTMYTFVLPALIAPRSLTVTATVGHPGATLAIAGVAAASGVASAPVPVGTGARPIEIVVTAPDRMTTRGYTIDAAYLTDYIKPSTTRSAMFFGDAQAIALSGDTLVVGAHREQSSAVGVNGDQSSSSSPSAGAVYVFTRAAGVWSQQAYIKASNTRADAQFGSSVALSGDTLAVGSIGESSPAKGVDGSQADGGLANAGAVYVFTRTGSTWSQQAYIKASNTRPSSDFGNSVALSGDTLAVGSQRESSGETGIGGLGNDTSASSAGAVYVFARSGSTWTQQAYVKASNTRLDAGFGTAVALSGDTLIAGSPGETSAATGVNVSQADGAQASAGAAYVFTRTGVSWTQQAYVKASNTRAQAGFGSSVAIAGDLLVVGSPNETSAARGVNGVQTADMNFANAGAAYVFSRSGSAWSQEAYLKASNTSLNASFATSLAVATDTVVASAYGDPSAALGVNGDETNTSAPGAGAAYVFARAGGAWAQRAYLKATNTRTTASFGSSLALSGDTLAVGSDGESSGATGVNGNAADRGVGFAGAAYVFR